MQFGKVISFKNFGSLFLGFKKNMIMMIFGFLFILGFIISIFSFKQYNSFAELFNDVVKDFFVLRNSESILKVATDSFLRNFTYLILMYFFGTSVLGVAVLPFVSIICGMYYGGIFASLYSIYSFAGITYSLVFVLPSAVIFSSILMRSAKESVDFSIKTARLTFSNSMPYSLYFDFKNYCNKYILFTVFLIFIAILDGFVSFYFGKSIKL